MAGMSQWVEGVMPEWQGKLTQAIQTHGWGPGAPQKTR